MTSGNHLLGSTFFFVSTFISSDLLCFSSWLGWVFTCLHSHPSPTCIFTFCLQPAPWPWSHNFDMGRSLTGSSLYDFIHFIWITSLQDRWYLTFIVMLLQVSRVLTQLKTAGRVKWRQTKENLLFISVLPHLDFFPCQERICYQMSLILFNAFHHILDSFMY